MCQEPGHWILVVVSSWSSRSQVWHGRCLGSQRLVRLAEGWLAHCACGVNLEGKARPAIRGRDSPRLARGRNS